MTDEENAENAENVEVCADCGEELDLHCDECGECNCSGECVKDDDAE